MLSQNHHLTATWILNDVLKSQSIHKTYTESTQYSTLFAL